RDAACLRHGLPGQQGARLCEAERRHADPARQRLQLFDRGHPDAQRRGAGGGQAMSQLVAVKGRTYRNLVEGTFESGVGTWVQGSAQSPVSVSTAQKRRGEQSLSAQRTGSTGAISFWSNSTSTAPSTRPGERYVFRAWLRTSTSMGGVRLRVQWLTSAESQVSITTGDQFTVASGEWILFELEATAPATAAKFRFGVDRKSVVEGKRGASA